MIVLVNQYIFVHGCLSAKSRFCRFLGFECAEVFSDVSVVLLAQVWIALFVSRS